MAEIKALQELSPATKSRLFPVVRIRPWMNAKSITRAYEVVEAAVGEGQYGFDLDITRLDVTSDRPAVQEFSSLFRPNHGFESYYEAVHEGQFRIPVFRDLSSPNPQIAQQIEHVRSIDRGVIVRIDVANPGAYLQLAQACLDEGVNNVAFIFDGGWRQDLLGLSAVTAGLVNSLLDIYEDFEISVAGSTFPDSFADQGIRFSQSIFEVEYFNQVRSAVNRGRLTYGDWASTRRPTESSFARNVPRIDLARPNSWEFWRRDGNEDYRNIAQRVVDDPVWDGNLDKWGNYIVQCTADGLSPSIKTPVMAAAARINLHMIAQAHQDDAGAFSVPDEPVGDDF